MSVIVTDSSEVKHVARVPDKQVILRIWQDPETHRLRITIHDAASNQTHNFSTLPKALRWLTEATRKNTKANDPLGRHAQK